MQSNKSRSNAKQRIIDAAFEPFFMHGYEAASLSHIANIVGIRKSTIYTHFDSKEAIFLELLQDALELECAFLRTCFTTAPDLSDPGDAYCCAFKERYDSAVTLRFLIRMSYTAPVHLMDLVAAVFDTYLEVLTEQIQLALQPYNLSSEQLEMYTHAYIGVIDSLSVALLYAETLYEYRLKAMLMLYQNAIGQLSKKP